MSFWNAKHVPTLAAICSYVWGIGCVEGMVREQRLSIGSQVLPGTAGVGFRIWAPCRSNAQLVLESGPGSPAEIELESEGGYFSRNWQKSFTRAGQDFWRSSEALPNWKSMRA